MDSFPNDSNVPIIATGTIGIPVDIPKPRPPDLNGFIWPSFDLDPSGNNNIDRGVFNNEVF